MEKKSLPRGIRNNNPLNIIHGRSQWLGMAEEQTDRRFVQFKTMEYGIRAAFKNLQSYSRLKPRPCMTLRQYVTRWCPPVEKGNDTKRYIDFVAKQTGINPDQMLPKPREASGLWCRIVDAMIRMECGQQVPEVTIRKAWLMAFS